MFILTTFRLKLIAFLIISIFAFIDEINLCTSKWFPWHNMHSMQSFHLNNYTWWRMVLIFTSTTNKNYSINKKYSKWHKKKSKFIRYALEIKMCQTFWYPVLKLKWTMYCDVFVCVGLQTKAYDFNKMTRFLAYILYALLFMTRILKLKPKVLRSKDPYIDQC